MRKVLLGLVAAVLLVVLVAVLLAVLVDVNRFRPQVQARLEEALGRDVTLGRMSLSYVPIAFRVDNAVIAEDPAFATGRPFAEIATLHVRPEIRSLFSGDVRIRSLQLGNPRIELVRNPQGTWNFTTIARDRDGGRQDVSFDRIAIYDGQVAVTDLQEGGKRTIYDHIDLTLRDLAAGRPFSIEVRAHMPGAGEQTLEFEGQAGPLPDGDLAATPFEGVVRLNEVSLSGLRRFLNGDALTGSDAVITGTADVENSRGVMTSTGRLQAQNVVIRGRSLEYPITADYNVSSNLAEDTLQIVKGELRLDDTPVSVTGNVNAASEPVRIDLDVRSPQASIAEAARLAAASGFAFDPGATVQGRMDLDIHAEGPAGNPELNGRILARDLRISGGGLPQPVLAPAIDLHLSPAELRSNEFSASTGNTTVRSQFTVANYRSESPRLTAKIDTGDAKLEELLRIAQAYGVSAVRGVRGSGDVRINATAAGPLRDRSRLIYTGDGSLANATVQLPSMAQPLRVDNAAIRFAGNSITLEDFSGAIAQTAMRGSLSIRGLESPQIEFRLSAGRADVADWQQLFTADREQPAEGPDREEGLMDRLTGSGQLQVEEVVYGELTLSDVESTVRLNRGVITLDPVTAQLYSGRHSGAIVIDTRTRQVHYSVDGQLQSVDANALLSAISPVDDTIYGALSGVADVQVEGVAAGPGLARSLDGRVSVDIQDGRVANLDLLRQLGRIAQFVGGAPGGEPFTRLIQASGDFDIVDGVAETNNFQASMDEGTLGVRGSIDLARSRLNLRVTAVLSREYSQAVGGTAIGGLLTTAVANNKGELVIPVIVTGTFEDPEVAPNIEEVARMRLENLAPSTADPSDPTIGILEELLGGPRETPPEPPPAEPEAPSEPAPEPETDELEMPSEEPDEPAPEEEEDPEQEMLEDILEEIFR